jgi:hypothetical protein
MEFLKCSPKIQGNRLRLEDLGELENQARRVRVKLSLPSCKEGSEDLSPRIPVTVGRVSTARLLGMCGNHG